MKKLIFVLVMLVGTASFANTGNPTVNLQILSVITEKVEKNNEAAVEEKVADDALYCSVVINGYRHTCWFCDCAAFIEALQN